MSIDALGWDPFAAVEVCVADGALQVDRAPYHMALEDRLRLLAEAPWAEVVHRLWSLWVVGPGRLWRDIEAIHECPGADLEQRVAFALRAQFFEYSNLLSQGRMLLLELHEGSIPRDHLSLKVDQFLRDLRNSGASAVEISDFQCGLCDRNRAADRGEGTRNE